MLLYNIAISLYGFGIRLAAFFNPKAKKWVVGREKLLERIEADAANFREETIWFHCASLGEYEMAKPVIEGLKSDHSDKTIILTFFSPSGFEIRSENSVADFVYYLPLDTRINAQRFVELIKPTKVVFVKYDLWFHHLVSAKKSGATLMLISAQFNLNQSYFKWYGAIQRKALELFDMIFLIDKESQNGLLTIGISNTIVCGDTRYDRVMEIAANASDNKFVEEFKNNDKLVVCGSTWAEDEAFLANAIKANPKVKWLFAPHEVDYKNIKRIKSQIPNTICFSNYKKSDAQVLILDSVGLLNSLYQYADVAYVGGGFKTGLHNILEATAFGVPTVFGPDTSRFPDAEELSEKGFAFKVHSGSELQSTLSQLLSNNTWKKKSDLIQFMKGRTGATTAILEYTNKC